MKAYRIITNPDGQREEIVAPLWDAIAEKVASDQVYLLYTSFNDFLSLLPIHGAESIINDFMDHLKEEAFLINLNDSSDEKGNIDWEHFFRYNDFIVKLYENIHKEDFKWTDFMKDYINT